MKRIPYFFIPFLFLFTVSAFAQSGGGYKWWNPAGNPFPVVEGQAWPGKVKDFYDRLPAKAETTVRGEVWELSKNSAGLYLKFNSNAPEITVRYVVTNKESFAMPHMPATGVSGIDLYALTQGGKWVWAPGRYKFADTVEYHFENIEVDPEFKGRDCEFRLFLPLYNSVSWMEIGVPAEKTFNPTALTDEKPIVIYGTSIAQGGCASRPGLAWTAILQRKLDRPMINLAFSGNGRLEKPVIDLINEIDASVYVLDCLPNMVASGGFTDDELEQRLTQAVTGIRLLHATTPILLADHSLSRRSGIIEKTRNEECERASAISQKVFAKFISGGMKNLYRLSTEEIGLDINSTVDGVHPNDIGMEKYAAAYANTLHNILHEPEGTLSTTIPVVQTRDGYDWRGRHEAIRKANKVQAPQQAIIANSIIHYWGGEPAAGVVHGGPSWKKYLEPLKVQNMGFGWDRIENALWRIYHGELDGYDAKHVVLMIGTNNLELNTDAEIISGLRQLISAVQFRQPRTRVLLSGIFPRRGLEKRVSTINLAYAKLATEMHANFINPGVVLLKANGKVDESLLSDGLHPNEKGYEKLGPAIARTLVN